MSNTSVHDCCQDDDGREVQFSPKSSQDLTIGVTAPEDHDVICGTSVKGSSNHPGNIHFRRTIRARKNQYLKIKKHSDRTRFIRVILNEFRSGAKPSRFLLKNEKTNLWFDIGDERARLKIYMAFRTGREAKAEVSPEQRATHSRVCRSSPVPRQGADLTMAVPAPQANDVFCGNETIVQEANVNHPRNIQFHQMVQARKEEYRQAKRPRDRTRIEEEIFAAFRRGATPSRFLRKDDKTKLWFDIGDLGVRQKITSALRNGNALVVSKKSLIAQTTKTLVESRSDKRPIRLLVRFSSMHKKQEMSVRQAHLLMIPRRPDAVTQTTSYAPGNTGHSSALDGTRTVIAPDENDITFGRNQATRTNCKHVCHPGNVKQDKVEGMSARKARCPKTRPRPTDAAALATSYAPGNTDHRAAQDGTLTVFAPEENDILFGSSETTRIMNACHPGNIRLLQLIRLRKEEYSQEIQIGKKAMILNEILNELRSGEKPSRFLQKDVRTNRWFEIGEVYARKKVRDALYSRKGQQGARLGPGSSHKTVVAESKEGNDNAEEDEEEEDNEVAMLTTQLPTTSLRPHPPCHTMTHSSGLFASTNTELAPIPHTTHQKAALTAFSGSARKAMIIPVVSPELSVDDRFQIDDALMVEPKVKEEDMAVRANHADVILNQYYCDIIDMEQHSILFDRLSRMERWHILKHFMSSYRYKDKEYGRVYIRTLFCGLLVDACSEPGYSESSLIAWRPKDWHEFMDDLDRTKVTCLRPDCHVVFGRGPDLDHPAKQSAEERSQLAAFTTKYTVVDKACQIGFHLAPIRLTLEDQIAAGGTGPPKYIPPEFIQALFATAKSSDSSVIKEQLLRLFVCDPVSDGQESVSAEVVIPRPILRNLEELKGILGAKPFNLLWFQSRVEQLIWLWNEACFGLQRPYLQIISYHESDRRDPDTPRSRRRDNQSLLASPLSVEKMEPTLTASKRPRESLRDGDDSYAENPLTAEISKGMVALTSSEDEEEEEVTLIESSGGVSAIDTETPTLPGRTETTLTTLKRPRESLSDMDDSCSERFHPVKIPKIMEALASSEDEEEEEEVTLTESDNGGTTSDTEEKDCAAATPPVRARLGPGTALVTVGTKMYSGPPPDEGIFDAQGHVLRRHPWTEAEVAALRAGYATYGVGKWARIKQAYGHVLRNRNSVQIKDKFRTLQRRGEVPGAV